MPILPTTDARIATLELWKELDSPLPSFSEALSTFVPLAHAATEHAWEVRAMTNFNLATQKNVGGVLSNLGVPQGKAFDTAIEFIGLPNEVLHAGTLFWDALGEKAQDAIQNNIKEILTDIATEVLGSLVNALGAIPIYGWIVEALWDVGTGIASLVKAAKASNAGAPEPIYARATFGPESDKNVLNHFVLRPMRESQDWTPLFCPPGVGRNTTFGPRFSASKLEGGGYRILTRGAKDGWLGGIPGTTRIHQGFEVSSGGEQIRELGQLFPSSRELFVWAWSQVTKRGPQMFTVDAAGARKYWLQYLFDLRMWIRETDKLTEREKQRLVDGVGVKLFGWGPYDMPFEKNLGYENFGLDDPEEKIPWKRVDDINCPQLGTATPVRSLEVLAKRQRYALDRITCAYVDKHYGAFVGKSSTPVEFRTLLEKRQGQLLSHRARCLVDVKNIPNAIYRSAFELAKEDCPPLNYAIPGMIDIPLVLSAHPQPPPPVDPIPAGPTTLAPANLIAPTPFQPPRRRSGAGGAALAALTGGAILMWALRSKRA